MHSDPIADMLTRIRNAARIGKSEVNIKASKICEGVAAVLKEEGFINGFDRIDNDKQGVLRVQLKYDNYGLAVLRTIDRVSRPGRRVYSAVEDLPHVLNGMGVVVVSTSKGVLSDRKCRREKVGGEILCTVS
ncbi:MAG: 30S ribosomal protein S8 [Phycisphaerae bacterium]